MQFLKIEIIAHGCVGMVHTSIVYKGITSIWKSYVCPEDQFEEWYKCDCLMGTCELRGPYLLPLCIDENNPNHDYEDDDFDFNWRQYKKVTTCVSKAWIDRKCNKVCPIHSTPKVFLRF
jgi:hypothetical protein